MEATSVNIQKYNRLCRHYEIVANSCYSARLHMAHALSDDYFPSVISALIVFDMQRQMGSGLASKYDKSSNGFAARLGKVLESQAQTLYKLEMESIHNIDFAKYQNDIHAVYEALACNGVLAESEKSFHVGATKILHFIHPNLFPIVDSNSAAVLRDKFYISYKKTGQPDYTKEKYISSMKKIQEYILGFGVDRFQLLEPGTPLTRIFDKLAFVHGSGI